MFVFFLQNYHYRIKIIYTNKGSDFVIREIHGCHKKFESIRDLKSTLIDKFKETLPDGTFNVGYFLGKQSSKHWHVSQDDLTSMYVSIGSKKEIMPWCDAKSTKQDV